MLIKLNKLLSIKNIYLLNRKRVKTILNTNFYKIMNYNKYIFYLII